MIQVLEQAGGFQLDFVQMLFKISPEKCFSIDTNDSWTPFFFFNSESVGNETVNILMATSCGVSIACQMLSGG